MDMYFGKTWVSSLDSNQGKIPEFTMVNRPILNSSKRSYKINKAPEKTIEKKWKGNTKQTNKTKKKERNDSKNKQTNKPKTTTKATPQQLSITKQQTVR